MIFKKKVNMEGIVNPKKHLILNNRTKLLVSIQVRYSQCQISMNLKLTQKQQILVLMYNKKIYYKKRRKDTLNKKLLQKINKTHIILKSTHRLLQLIKSMKIEVTQILKVFKVIKYLMIGKKINIVVVSLFKEKFLLKQTIIEVIQLIFKISKGKILKISQAQVEIRKFP